MKTLLLLLLTYTILNIVFGENAPLRTSVAERIYPKKVNALFDKHIKIMNRKYIKKTTAEIVEPTKKKNSNPAYTAFPLYHKTLSTAPTLESSSFALDADTVQKPRVKKVLHDYVWTSLRKKRSADSKDIKKPVKLDKTSKGNSSKNVKRNRDKLDRKAEPKLRKVKKVKRTHNVKGASRNKNVKKPLKNIARKTKQSKKSKSSKAKPSQLKVNASRRLIAGRDAIIETFPYVVSIQKDREHWCAGALLNQRLVITTANCVWKSSRMSRLRVRAGTRHPDRGGQVAKIQEVVKHPNWSIRKNPDNDLALLLLDRNIKFSHSVHAVDLPNRVMLPVFEDAWITGWGAERRDGIYDKNDLSLQVFHARFMDRDKCNNVTERFGVTVTENFICLSQNGRRAPCTRDTGAPAVSDGVLWGLASWGLRKLCGTERFPAMFSYVASHSNMDFIIKATTYLMSEERHLPFADRFQYETVVTQPTTLYLV